MGLVTIIMIQYTKNTLGELIHVLHTYSDFSSMKKLLEASIIENFADVYEHT